MEKCPNRFFLYSPLLVHHSSLPSFMYDDISGTVQAKAKPETIEYAVYVSSPTNGGSAVPPDGVYDLPDALPESAVYDLPDALPVTLSDSEADARRCARRGRGIRRAQLRTPCAAGATVFRHARLQPCWVQHLQSSADSTCLGHAGKGKVPGGKAKGSGTEQGSH